MDKKKLYESIMKNVSKQVTAALNEYHMVNGPIMNLWDEIVSRGIATTSELQLVTDLNGLSMETLNSVIFSRTGYRSLAQMDGEVEKE